VYVAITHDGGEKSGGGNFKMGGIGREIKSSMPQNTTLIYLLTLVI
jgi:hypothetical protein